ncbi:hypothetical protein SO694_0001230 [Aureococcus anophagefferens]|uniref:Uncharacterized protein n=1 Tax=Aureococcus anophagefferens TaxID=44056 RepID=A0ABR1G190_AURAN
MGDWPRLRSLRSGRGARVKATCLAMWSCQWAWPWAALWARAWASASAHAGVANSGSAVRSGMGACMGSGLVATVRGTGFLGMYLAPVGSHFDSGFGGGSFLAAYRSPDGSHAMPYAESGLGAVLASAPTIKQRTMAAFLKRRCMRTVAGSSSRVRHT